MILEGIGDQTRQSIRCNRTCAREFAHFECKAIPCSCLVIYTLKCASLGCSG